MNNEEKVKAKHPDAECVRFLGEIKYRVWGSRSVGARHLGSGNTEPEAWQNAADQLTTSTKKI